MAYDNIISRTDAAALMPEDVAREIIGNVPQTSAALSLFRNRPMSRAQTRLPVKSALPTAYFVTGDTGLKQTTEVNWDDVYLNVEEIACIVPIPENVFDDADYDVWGEIQPDIEEAVGLALDGAVFFGANKPASWPDSIAAGAVAAGNVVARGTNNAAAGGIAGDINDLMGKVEDDGFDVNGFVAKRSIRSKLRGARDTTGQKLMDLAQNEIEGAPVKYAMAGQWPSGASAAEMFAGDWTQGIIGVRQDITYKILTESVIQDNAGNILYNLSQQDMIAMRVKARFAFAVPNPINRENSDSGTRYPFSVLRSPA